MKKNKNFLKKLTAGILGFVMTLGVGAAGYSASASETRAVDTTYSFTSKSWEDSTKSWKSLSDGYAFDSAKSAIQRTAGSCEAETKSSISNITKISINAATTSKGVGKYTVYVGGTSVGSKDLSKNSTFTDYTLYDGTAISGVVKINLNCTTNSLYIKSITITTGSVTPTKEVSSIEIGGDMTNKSYTTDDTFDPAGLTVTANYSDSTSEYVTNDAEFSFNPSALTAGMTQVTVTASYGGKTATKTVTGLTVRQSTATSSEKNSFSAISGYIDEQGKYIAYAATQGDATNPPVINSSKIRLYKPASGKSTGGLLTFTPENGATIKEIEFKSNRASNVKYRLDSGSLNELTASGSSPSTYKISNLNISSNTTNKTIVIVNCYDNSNDISYIKVAYELPPEKQLTSISVTSQPTKKNYSVGDAFNTAGMVVKANYDDSTSETITDYTVSPSTMASTTTSVTITYNGKTATVTGIDVSNYKGIEVTGITDANRTFTVGDKFSFGGSVNKVYGHSSGSDTRVVLTSSELSQCTFKLGGTTVTTDTALTINDNGKKVVVTYNGSSSTDSTGSYTIVVNYAKPTAVNIESTLALGPDDSYDFNDHFSVSPENAKQDATFEITSTTGDLTEDDYVFDEGYIWISDSNQHEGTLTVTASSVDNKEGGGKATATCVITVSADAAPVLQSLRCELGSSYIANQYVTKPLDLTGVIVYAVFDKGDDVDVTSQVEWDDNIEVGGHPYGMYADPLDSSIVEDITIEEITFIADILDSISFVDNCDLTNKSYFTTDSSLNFEGLSITGLMESGSTASIVQDDVEYSAPTPAAIGAGDSQSVTITASYGGKTATKEFSGIEIKAVTLQSISASHNSDEYEIGQTLDLSKVTVTGLNNDGTPATINKSDCDFSYAADTFLSAGTKTISVTHKPSGKTDTFSVKVNAKDIETTATWEKVTSTPTSWAGEYVFVLEPSSGGNSGLVFNGRDEVSNSVAGTIANGVISPSDGVNFETYKVIIEAVSGSTKYKIKTANPVESTKPYFGSTTSNGLPFTQTGAEQTIEFKDSEAGTINVHANDTTSFVFNNISGQDRFRFMKTPDNYPYPCLYKKVEQQSGVKSLAGITATYNHTGSEYHTGDSVVASDFTVKAWYDDGSTTDNVSGITIENPSLVEGNNNIHLSYTDGSATKDCYVAVNGITTRTATVDHVYVVAGTGYTQNYYLKSGETPAWDFSNIKVVAYYTDESTSEINLADFVNIEGNSVTHSVPTLNDNSFTVSGSYQGMAIDSAHNSVAVNVVNYQISKLDTWNLSTSFSFKIFEGEKFDLAHLGSVKVTYNDGTVESAQNVETLINQGKITLGLYSGSVTKDVTPDITVTKDTVWNSAWDGYRMAISAGSGFTDKNNSFRVVPLLNEVIAESDTPATQEFTTNILNDAGMSNSYVDSDKTISINGITYHYKNAKADGGFKIFKDSSKERYFYNSDPFTGAITKVEITEQYDNAYVKASDDGKTWDLVHSATGSSGSQTITIDATKNYKYIYFSSLTSYDANMSKVIVTYRGQGNIANTNLNGQDVATAFAKDFLANGTSENWSSMATSLSTAINALSTQAEKDNATNLLKYATTNANGDIVQKAVAKYDQIIADYNLVSNDFLERDIEATDHVITLDANGGSCGVESITMKNNTTYANLPTPTRDHYLFDGWYTKKTAGVKVSNGDTFDSASSITLYAHWTYKYDVTLNVNATDATDGSLSASYYLKDSENDQYITITDPSREGYTLTGYKITAENATLSGNTITIPAGTGGNITVTAQWSANAHTVTLNYDNGADPVIIDTYYDEKVDLSKYSPTKTGYTLSGWKDANGTEYGLTQVIEVKGDMSLTAQWTANTYTAIFDVNGGNPLDVNTKTVTYGQPLGELPTPTKNHYVFLGWYPTKTTEVDPVTGETIYLNTKDTTYYARWAYVYDVVFDYNAEDASGGTLTATNYAVDKNNDQTITITADPVREYYTVSGYTVTSEHATIEGNVITIPAGTGGKITINVQWEGKPYKVTLDYDNGTSVQNIDVVYAQKFNLSSYSPTKDGYTLSGWKDSNGNEYGLNDIISIDGNISLTAQWTGNPYVISFDGNGGSTPTNIDVEYGKAIGSLPESTLEHYTFLGWFTEKDGGTQVKVGDVYNTDGNTTLYAHWEANKHTVVINGKEQEVNYDNHITLDDAPTEVKEGGYFFSGWVCDADNQLYEGGATYTVPDKDVSFSAQWIKTIDNTITVTTQANFTYKYTVADGFQEVTGYSLRMYVSLDEVSYQYYVEHGYTFTINFINIGNGQVQILRNVPVWYDKANNCYVFDIGVKIPATKLETLLGVELVATPSSGDTCTSNTVEVTYMYAAQALYNEYKAGTVELNEEQVDALESILGIVDAE